jgi:hypothetical protein
MVAAELFQLARRANHKCAKRPDAYSLVGDRTMECSLLQKLEILHTAGTQLNPPHALEIVHTLYENLNVLDSKGLALLAFDGHVRG